MDFVLKNYITHDTLQKVPPIPELLTMPSKKTKSLGFFYVFLNKFLLLIKAVSIRTKLLKKCYFVKYYCNLKEQCSILIYF